MQLNLKLQLRLVLEERLYLLKRLVPLRKSQICIWNKKRGTLELRAHPVKLITCEQKSPKELTQMAKMWFRGTRGHPKWAVELSSVLHAVLALES